jgi:hypothetical protein
MCSMPRAVMSSMAPLAANAPIDPPWPSGFMATLPFCASSSLPVRASSEGSRAWGNMKMLRRLSPKQLLSRKNARVAASFSGLVMM